MDDKEIKSRAVKAVRQKRPGNRLLQRAFDDGYGLEDEARDLFYFFGNLRQYALSYFREPTLKPDHDDRLKYLLDAMEGINVRTLEDQSTHYMQTRMRDALHVPINEEESEQVRLASRFMMGIPSRDLMEGLSEEKLMGYLTRRTEKHHSRAFYSLVFGGAYGSILPQPMGAIGGGIIALFGVIGLPFSYPCFPYKVLLEKAERIDETIETAKEED